MARHPTDFNHVAAVPYALDPANNRVHSYSCRNERGSYRCPFCLGPVRLVRRRLAGRGQDGRARVSKFWRHRGPTCADSHHGTLGYLHEGWAGGGESELHEQAKRTIKRWLEDGAVRLLHRCAGGCEEVVGDFPLPRFTRVELEHPLEGGRRPDIALLDAFGDVVMLIEVRVTHSVNLDKRTELDIDWIEVVADEVMAMEQQRHLHVRDGSHVEVYCQPCAADLDVGRAWWRDYAHGPEIQAYMAAEFPRRLANLARSHELTMAFIRRLSAQICQQHELGFDAHERIERAIEFANSQGVKDPFPGWVPWLWYCRACCRPMLVQYWCEREHGESPPLELHEVLHRDSKGRWNEACPHCDAVQDIWWRCGLARI